MILTDQDAGLLEQAATMLELQAIDLRDRGQDSQAAGAKPLRWMYLPTTNGDKP